ncbi:MAG: SsrA-binding protein SmpB [Myxococcales bacterium]|nr:SsrA-binding protein SmpB [Myxococcales bacterium]
MAEAPIKVVARNRRVRHDYELTDTFEAGIVLVGSEVKVLRQGKCTLVGAHVRVIGNEAWLVGMQIPEYPFAHRFNHDVDRTRKLLLHKREVDKLDRGLRERGTSCVVVQVYFKGSKVKVEIALARGRKMHDKRHALKKKDAKREMARAKRDY